jgi:hypothetical protein
VILVDRESLETSRLGIELAAALQRMSPQDFGLEQTLGSIGSQAVIDALRAGRPPEEIVADWQTSPTSSASFTAFRAVRQKYLLY